MDICSFICMYKYIPHFMPKLPNFDDELFTTLSLHMSIVDLIKSLYYIFQTSVVEKIFLLTISNRTV
jgi:hypothetical protein